MIIIINCGMKTFRLVGLRNDNDCVVTEPADATSSMAIKLTIETAWN